MKITVDRYLSDKETTLSKVFVDNQLVCYGLEDEFREVKRDHETRIPAGTYTVAIRKVGGFHERYKKRFPDWHQGMLQVMNVPQFTDILIHIGNTDKDTAGCLLVGESADTSVGNMRINRSTQAYQRLYSQVIDAALKKDLQIEYINNDGNGS